MTQEEFDAVYEELSLKWLFNKSALPIALPITGMGLAHDEKGAYISVRLTREATETEKAEMPDEYKGVRLKYKVTGRIVTFSL